MKVTIIEPGRCPFSILVTEHYRADGSCRCNDVSHRVFMVNEWGYSPSDFANIPIAVEVAEA